ncbi:MAG: AGE family epimerase/isomerase [Phenylobacterium sp.]
MTPRFRTLDEAAAWYHGWLKDAALPLWAKAGVDSLGGFHEALTPDGRPYEAPRRARVQTRNVYVYASASTAGLEGDWLPIAVRAFDRFMAQYRRPDRLFVSTVGAAGAVLDPTPALYEQDFALLAMAALRVADPSRTELVAEATATLAALEALRHPAGGYREFGDHPFQANAHMHLLEAVVAWEETGAAGWADLADEIVELAMRRFIDPDEGFLREFFDADWRPAPGDDGRLVEPGHQFEWAWLLERWSRKRGDPVASSAARRLFAHGLRGVDAGRGVAINALWDDFGLRDASARLWPQTEYLKAALILGEDAEALTAANSLAGYLDTPAPGAWRDKLRPDGSFVEEPAPASSFYHLMVALLELLRAMDRLPAR